MAAILRDELTHTTDKLVEIAGGLDRLPSSMAALLPPNTIRFNTIVDGIESRGPEGGVVHLRSGETGLPTVLPFAHLLCTLPFPVLGKLPLGLRGFSTSKIEAIHGMGSDYSSATKILLQYDQRWWEKQPYEVPGGRSMSEEAILQTYYPTPASASLALLKAELDRPAEKRPFSIYTGDSPERATARSAAQTTQRAEDVPGVLLSSYTYNGLAQDFSAMDEASAVELVLNGIREFHPDIQPPQAQVVWSWDKNPWSGRAFTLTRPGTLSAFFQSAARPEGAIHFAGEHVSIAPAWIQGALESSLREVAKMVQWPPRGLIDG